MSTFPRRADVERRVLARSQVDRRTTRQLDRLDSITQLRLAAARSSVLVRSANVQAEAMIATVKVHDIDRVTKEAISGHAMLRYYADTAAHGDPMLADELRFFTDMARLGKGEVIADLVTDYCRESQRK